MIFGPQRVAWTRAEIGPLKVALYSHPLNSLVVEILLHYYCSRLSNPSIQASQAAMIFDTSTSDHLKTWLTKTLEPMSVLPLLHLIHSDVFTSSLDATLTHRRWPTTSSHC